MDSRITASRMGRIVQQDSQFHLPNLPRFPSAFAVIPTSDVVIVHGGEELAVFRGRARDVLNRLLPMLDGTRDIGQICGSFREFSSQAVIDCIALLYMRGLLEDAAADGTWDLSSLDQETVFYFQRQLDSTRIHASSLQGIKKLKETHLGVYTNISDSYLLREGLLQAGIGEVSLQDFGVDIRLTNETFVLAAVNGNLSELEIRRLADVCARQEIPWLLSLTCGHMGMLGPYFERSETACYGCFEELLQGMADFTGDTPSLMHDIDMWIQYTILEVCNFLSRLGPAITGMDFMVLNLADWHGYKRRVPKRPGCPHCLPMADVKPGLPPLPMQFEYEVHFPSGHLSTPKAHQAHYKPSNLALAQVFKTYADIPAIPLGERKIPKGEGRTVCEMIYHPLQEQGEAELSLDYLSSILLCGTGIRGTLQLSEAGETKVQRYAPTGGNLGSVQIYIISFGVRDLAAGIYYYHPWQHTLSALVSIGEPSAVNQAVTGTSDSLPDAIIVTTGALERVQAKYSAFAFRVIHLDAGVALAQMQLAAAACGIAFRPLSEWREAKLVDLLQIEPMQEPITGVYMLGRGAI